jgi:FtsP/CotA-like multicopper oxidase with cupredoxin domain
MIAFSPGSPRRSEHRGLTRRQLLVASGLAGMGLASGACRPDESTFEPDGSQPLPIHPLAPAETVNGDRQFALTVSTGESRLIAGRPDVRTPTMGYNGAFLGPTLRARRGERITVDIRNDLSESTTVHWHGMRLPAAMDGGPHSLISPGQTFRAEWDLQQPAATLWYHPHPHHETERQVLNGLAGFFIIDDEPSTDSGLPSEYGVDDIPLVLQDKYLDDDGHIVRTEPGDGNVLGTVGSTLLANGVSGTYFTVTTEIIRLRVLNGCASRFLDLRFDDGRPFTLVGMDGGLLPEPVELERLLLSPAERAELLVRLQPEDRVTLRTERPEMPGVRGGAFVDEMIAGNFVEFRAESELSPAREWQLPPDQRSPLDPPHAAETRTFVMEMPFLNDQRMDMTRIDAIVHAGDIEIWEVSTTDRFPHNWHVHEVQFRILDINGAPPPSYLDGWKDTIPVFPGETTRTIMQFGQYTDDRIPYMMHCHMLQHEDRGMMGQFLVTDDGTGPERIEPPADHDAHTDHDRPGGNQVL